MEVQLLKDADDACEEDCSENDFMQQIKFRVLIRCMIMITSSPWVLNSEKILPRGRTKMYRREAPHRFSVVFEDK